MRTIILVLLAVVGCGGESPADRLVGDWIYVTADQSSGLAVAFADDGTYVAQTLVLTSATSAYDEVETGVYTASDDEITTTPQKWTCPGPYPAYSAKYSFRGDLLTIATEQTVLALEPNQAAPTSVQLTFGCFAAGGFVPAPLAAVSN